MSCILSMQHQLKNDLSALMVRSLNSLNLANDEIPQRVGKHSVNEHGYCIKNCKGQQASDYENQDLADFA